MKVDLQRVEWVKAVTGGGGVRRGEGGGEGLGLRRGGGGIQCGV